LLNFIVTQAKTSSEPEKISNFFFKNYFFSNDVSFGSWKNVYFFFWKKKLVFYFLSHETEKCVSNRKWLQKWRTIMKASKILVWLTPHQHQSCNLFHFLFYRIITKNCIDIGKKKNWCRCIIAKISCRYWNLFFCFKPLISIQLNADNDYNQWIDYI